MNKRELQAVMQEYPQLTEYGFDVYGTKFLSPEEVNEEKLRSRRSLLASVDASVKLSTLLSCIGKTKSINNKHSDSSLKQLFEDRIGYVTNGLFIAAALHSGFFFSYGDVHTSVYFNMSERDISRLSSKSQPAEY